MKNIRSHLLLLVSLALVSTAVAQDNAKPPVRVACVGDSITRGLASKNPYPAQLQALLGPGYVVKNFGVDGRTLLKKGDMPYWKDCALTDAQRFNPNIVVIMLGTNDTKPHNWIHFDEFTANYKELVEIFKNLPSRPALYLCRPCPAIASGNYGINEPDIQKEIPAIDQVARDEGTQVLDMHAALAGKPQLFPDHIHPNANGDAIIAKVVAAALKARTP